MCKDKFNTFIYQYPNFRHAKHKLQMIDYYKISLEILAQILREEKYDHWANWMLEDIKLWENEKSVKHHLHAYGGMGSFNDIVVEGNDNEGVWKNRIFGSIQTLAYSLASGDSLDTILGIILNQNRINQISGWRCRDCGDARINNRAIDLYIASFFVPKLLVECIQKGQLKKVTDISKWLDSEDITNKRQSLKAEIEKANIDLNTDNDWLWICPKCGSKEVCAYRWIVLENNAELVEADDNLVIKKQY